MQELAGRGGAQLQLDESKWSSAGSDAMGDDGHTISSRYTGVQ